MSGSRRRSLAGARDVRGSARPVALDRLRSARGPECTAVVRPSAQGPPGPGESARSAARAFRGGRLCVPPGAHPAVHRSETDVRCSRPSTSRSRSRRSILLVRPGMHRTEEAAGPGRCRARRSRTSEIGGAVADKSQPIRLVERRSPRRGATKTTSARVRAGCVVRKAASRSRPESLDADHRPEAVRGCRPAREPRTTDRLVQLEAHRPTELRHARSRGSAVASVVARVRRQRAAARTIRGSGLNPAPLQKNASRTGGRSSPPARSTPPPTTPGRWNPQLRSGQRAHRPHHQCRRRQRQHHHRPRPPAAGAPPDGDETPISRTPGAPPRAACPGESGSRW